MDADYSVELGADDPALEMPWSDPEGRLHYQNLRRDPETLALIAEALEYRELGEFLVAVNSSESILESAKCDIWTDNEVGEAEGIYGGESRFASYVDLLFCDEWMRFDFATLEAFVVRTTEALERTPHVPAVAEFVVRRCYYKVNGAGDESAAGYYFTFYISGYGANEADARKHWAKALAAVRDALLAGVS